MPARRARPLYAYILASEVVTGDFVDGTLYRQRHPVLVSARKLSANASVPNDPARMCGCRPTWTPAAQISEASTAIGSASLEGLSFPGEVADVAIERGAIQGGEFGAGPGDLGPCSVPRGPGVVVGGFGRHDPQKAGTRVSDHCVSPEIDLGSS